MYPKITDIKRPVKKGEIYLVPCVVKSEGDVCFIDPIIYHAHNDIENGQMERHFHLDYRFIKTDENGHTINRHSRQIWGHTFRPHQKDSNKIYWHQLPVINEKFAGITDVKLISKSKLKHKCIVKGKCPHRGFDLSQVNHVDGVITCPLHGLRFDEKTKQLLS